MTLRAPAIARCRALARDLWFGAAEGRRGQHCSCRVEEAESPARQRITFAIDSPRQGRFARVEGEHSRLSERHVRTLDPYCTAFLYTHIVDGGDDDGVSGRCRAGWAAHDSKAADRRRRHTHTREVGSDAMGVDAVVGMAIYTGAMQ